MLPNCQPYNLYCQLSCVKIGHYCSYMELNAHKLSIQWTKSIRLWLSPPLASAILRSGEGGSITDHGTWPWISGIRGALLPDQWRGMGNASLSPRGHLSATITLGPHTSSHPVAGSTSYESVWGVLATQISARIPPWCPAQRCQSRLSGTSLRSRPTLNIAFRAYLSW